MNRRIDGKYIPSQIKVHYCLDMGGGRMGDETEPQAGDRIFSPSPTVRQDLEDRGFNLDWGDGNGEPSRGFADGTGVSAQGTYRCPLIVRKDG